MAPKNDTEAEELAPLRAPEGGTAFPRFPVLTEEGEPIHGTTTPGMSLRDYFAGQALLGIILKFGDVPADPVLSKAPLAEDAYQIADAMLAERSRR